MSNRISPPLFYLLADYAEGPWGGVIADWCNHTQQSALSLTDDPAQATAYLIVARYDDQAATAISLGLIADLPIVWINDHNGTVQWFDSLPALQARVDAAPARQGPAVGAVPAPPRTYHVADGLLLHLTHASIPAGARPFSELFAPMPDAKLFGGFVEAGEFDGCCQYQFETSVEFQLGPDGKVWACIGSIDDVPESRHP
jgi:hypothetical protein